MAKIKAGKTKAGAQPPRIRRKGTIAPQPLFGTQTEYATTGPTGLGPITNELRDAIGYPFVPNYAGTGSAGDGFKAFDQPDPGTFEVYRRIARYPTVAMPLSVIDARAANTGWDWKHRDKDKDARSQTEDPKVKLLKRWFAPQRAQIVRDGMLALRYGFSPFEKVWELVDPKDFGVEMSEKVLLPRLKPLRVDYTTFLADKALTKVTGLRNRPPYATGDVDLMEDKHFWFTFGGEAGDPYGESLFENIRGVWSEADQVRRKISRYINKVSGVIGQIHYPDGTSKNASGTDTPNYVLAQQLAAAAAEGKWLVMQNRFASFIVDPQNVTPANLEKALAAAGKAEWVVSFVDPGGTDHSGGFKELLQYYDVLLVRGILQPERSLLESQQSGSRADSQSHGQMGALFPESLVTGFVLNFNVGVVDNILEMNDWGAKGSIYADPEPISDDEYDAKLKTLHAMLQSPDTGPGISKKVDVEKLMDDLGVPVDEDERGEPLETLAQLMPPELKLPKVPGRNGNGPRTEPVGRKLF